MDRQIDRLVPKELDQQTGQTRTRQIVKTDSVADIVEPKEEKKEKRSRKNLIKIKNSK